MATIRPSWRTERALWREGRGRVAGVDEAGRGPLAGPVVAGAVVLPFTRARWAARLRAHTLLPESILDTHTGPLPNLRITFALWSSRGRVWGIEGCAGQERASAS